nr:hypothetical protein [uncultured Draconibacterium sp.]
MIICNKKFQDINNICNKPLFESEHFKVIPSIGSIVEGWLLMIPKTHFISFAYMSQELLIEAQEVSVQIINIIKKEYNSDVVVFENGAGELNTKIGCGVDYAHIHFVPIKINAKHIIDSFYKRELLWKKIFSLKELSTYKTNYYLINDSSNYFVGIPPFAESQLIRKGIAESVGMPHKFDWKKYPFEENVVKTINRFKHQTIEINEQLFVQT